jgi:hypothetical protein
MSSPKIIALATVVLALAAGACTLLIPTPSTEGGAAFHSSLLQSVITVVVQLGAASLFVWGLKGFRHELRVAYGIICAGIVLLGFSNLQLPIVTYFDLSESIYVRGGIITIPYIAPALLVFFGVRLFAKLFQLKTIWMSFWFVMVLAVFCAACAVGLGNVLAPSSGKEFAASIALSAWTAVFLLASTLVVLSVKRIAGPIYQDALRWFAAARVVVTLTGLAYTVVLIFFGDQSAVSKYGYILLPSALSAFLFLRSGYGFKLINEDDARQTAAKTVNLIDVVTFAASQASNPSQIDAMLDPLRLMTAELGGGAHTLTSEQQETLKQIYARIERYLVEEEPLRRLTTEGVRRKCAQYFGIEYDSFVAMISPATARTAAQPPLINIQGASLQS